MVWNTSIFYICLWRRTKVITPRSNRSQQDVRMDGHMNDHQRNNIIARHCRAAGYKNIETSPGRQHFLLPFLFAYHWHMHVSIMFKLSYKYVIRKEDQSAKYTYLCFFSSPLNSCDGTRGQRKNILKWYNNINSKVSNLINFETWESLSFKKKNKTIKIINNVKSITSHTHTYLSKWLCIVNKSKNVTLYFKDKCTEKNGIKWSSVKKFSMLSFQYHYYKLLKFTLVWWFLFSRLNFAQEYWNCWDRNHQV